MFKRFLVIAVLTATLNSFAEDKTVKIQYAGKIAIKNLHKGQKYVLNRSYVFTDVPKNLLFNKITIMNGNARKPIAAKVPANSYLYLCLDSGRRMKKAEAAEVKEYVKVLRRQGWRSSGRIKTSDKRMQYLQVFRKKFYKAATEKLIGVGFPGVMIIAKNMELVKNEE